MTARRPQQAIAYGDGTRGCNQCGCRIDPIDWCPDCQAKQAPCGVHTRLRMRSDAAFCDAGCRAAYANDVAGLNPIARPRRGASIA